MNNNIYSIENNSGNISNNNCNSNIIINNKIYKKINVLEMDIVSIVQ